MRDKFAGLVVCLLSLIAGDAVLPVCSGKPVRASDGPGEQLALRNTGNT